MVEEAPAASPSKKPAFMVEANNGLCCPECSSKRLYKDGLRYLADGCAVQRYHVGIANSAFHGQKLKSQGGNMEARI
ncbi:MAG: hypothetical protein QXG09_02570 [Candidatus Bathyarchaeia archaeon]